MNNIADTNVVVETVKKQSTKKLVHCLRCWMFYFRNTSTQKMCTHCGNIINRLRRYGLVGKWTKAKEFKIIKKHPEGMVD